MSAEVAAFARRHRITLAQARRILKDAAGDAAKADALAAERKAKWRRNAGRIG